MDLHKHLDALFDSSLTMDKESERGCLLVGLAEIEDALGQLLSVVLKQHGSDADADWLLDEKAGNRPLGTLAIRTRAARCLGLIDDEIRCVIDRLRKLRNDVAHGTSMVELTKAHTAPIINAFSHTNQLAVKEMLRVPTDKRPEWEHFSEARKELMASIMLVNVQVHIMMPMVMRYAKESPVGEKKTPAD